MLQLIFVSCRFILHFTLFFIIRIFLDLSIVNHLICDIGKCRRLYVTIRLLWDCLILLDAVVPCILLDAIVSIERGHLARLDQPVGQVDLRRLVRNRAFALVEL